MIDECRCAVSIDHLRAVGEAEKIGARRVFVERVGFGYGDSRASVFGDQRAFLDRPGGVASVRMNLGTTYNEFHLIAARRRNESSECQSSATQHIISD